MFGGGNVHKHSDARLAFDFVEVVEQVVARHQEQGFGILVLGLFHHVTRDCSEARQVTAELAAAATGRFTEILIFCTRSKMVSLRLSEQQGQELLMELATGTGAPEVLAVGLVYRNTAPLLRFRELLLHIKVIAEQVTRSVRGEGAADGEG